jgi:hypothetical protein
MPTYETAMKIARVMEMGAVARIDAARKATA